jgi:hypothetical protein
VLKQTLQGVQREGFDKLIDILQKDLISPQLVLLRQQLQQQLQKQDASIEVLERVYCLLQQNPTSSDLQGLHTLSQQQQALQKEFSQALQDIQTRTSEQVRLRDLYKQDQQRQEMISLDLQNISAFLKEMRDGPSVPLSLPDHRESGYLSDRQEVAETIPAVVPETQPGESLTDQQEVAEIIPAVVPEAYLGESLSDQQKITESIPAVVPDNANKRSLESTL